MSSRVPLFQIPTVKSLIACVEKVRYFKGTVANKAKFHGMYENVFITEDLAVSLPV